MENQDLTVFMQQFSSFMEYFKEFTEKKRNQLDFSNTTVPNRVIPIRGLDLGVDLNGLFREYQIPFRSIHVEKIYSAVTGLAVEGEIKMAFDYNNINGIRNYKLLQANDSFILDQTISKFALGWDVQSNVLVDIACMIDTDYKAGSTKTSITGAVSSIVVAPPVPSSVFGWDVGTNGIFTVQAGKVAKVCAILTDGANILINGDQAGRCINSTITTITPNANLWVFPNAAGNNPAPTVGATAAANGTTEGILASSVGPGNTGGATAAAGTALKSVFTTTTNTVVANIVLNFTMREGDTLEKDAAGNCDLIVEYYDV